MSRFLSTASGRILALGVVAALVFAAASPGQRPGRHAPDWLLADTGGGYGGLSGSAIWAATWWKGSPQGPGPYTGAPNGGAGLCIWHDLGPSLADLNGGLSEASLPLSFWDQPQGGGHPGIWGVDEWARSRPSAAHPGAHFDLVACPQPSQVPPNGGDVEASLPEAYPPASKPLYVWIFWDTVPDPPSGGLPPLVAQAFAETNLPAPSVGTSPSAVGGVADATVVNFPTWLWVDSSVWHEYSATASSHGYVATVWAWPTGVNWTASWDLTDKSSNPEGGLNSQPERLDQSCPDPGAVYDLARPAAGQSTDCSFVFTQSSFGTAQTLAATISWDVMWAYSDTAGVVGDEGDLGPAATTGTRTLRVLQIESVITRG